MLRDFFSTHTISNDEIYLRYGVGGWGGGLIDFLPAWEQVLAVIQAGVAVVDAGIYSWKAVSYIRGSLVRRWKVPKSLQSLSPARVLSLIAGRKYWNAYELSDLTGWPVDRLSHLLKGLGFQYDSQRHQFVSTIVTTHRFEKLNAMKFSVGERDRRHKLRKPYARSRRQ